MELKPGYKQTEVGVIPEEWEPVTILDVCRKILDYRGRTPRKLGMDWGGEIPALSARNVRMGYIDFEQECYFGSDALYKRWMTNGDVAKGDILVTMEAPLGNVAVIPDGRRYILSQRTILLQLDPDMAASSFLFQLILSEWFQSQLSENATGSTAQGIQRKKFEQLHVVRPPLPEQRAIAGVLGDVDALLGALTRLIAKKRDLKQAAMQQLLTGQTRLPGFSKSSHKSKQTGVGAIPDDWNAAPLEATTIKIQDGTHFSPTMGGNDFLYVTSRNIGFGRLDVSDAERIDATQHQEIYSRCDVREGDVLLTKDGANTGNAAMNTLDEEVSLLSSVAFLRFDSKEFSPAFFLYQILSSDGQQRIKTLMSGNAITRLTLQKIRALCFAFPPFAEQTAIAAVLSDMDAELGALEQRLAKTRALKQGMMQELLTGKTRLV